MAGAVGAAEAVLPELELEFGEPELLELCALDDSLFELDDLDDELLDELDGVEGGCTVRSDAGSLDAVAACVMA